MTDSPQPDRKDEENLTTLRERFPGAPFELIREIYGQKKTGLLATATIPGMIGEFARKHAREELEKMGFLYHRPVFA